MKIEPADLPAEATDGPEARKALVTGATGFIGGRLIDTLRAAGWSVRCLVRGRGSASSLSDRGVDIREGDVLNSGSLAGVGGGIDVAYYLIHAMGRGGETDFSERERRGAENFALMASREGIRRVIYLGGLGDDPKSEHLLSRQRTAEVLSELGPPLTYFRFKSSRPDSFNRSGSRRQGSPTTRRD